jgi:hypothetical protein
MEDYDNATDRYAENRLAPIELFISHSSINKKFASQLSDELLPYGIEGFVAHEDIAVNQEWQLQIEVHLNNCNAFLFISDEDSSNSFWCNQEIGWACGLKKPIFCIWHGVPPKGFISKIQYPSVANNIDKSRDLVLEFLDNTNLKIDRVVDNLLHKLKSETSDFRSAGDICDLVLPYAVKSKPIRRRFAEIYFENSQLYRGFIAHQSIGRATGVYWEGDDVRNLMTKWKNCEDWEIPHYLLSN